MTDHFLFDDYLIGEKILCNGNVTKVVSAKVKSLIISHFLGDGYVIGSQFLLDGCLMEEK